MLKQQQKNKNENSDSGDESSMNMFKEVFSFRVLAGCHLTQWPLRESVCSTFLTFRYHKRDNTFCFELPYN